MSSSAFTPSTTTVTNNVPVNVPVVTAGELYTPTAFGFTYGSNGIEWTRQGDLIFIKGRFTTSATSGAASLSLPLNLTARTPGGLDVFCGKWVRSTAATNQAKQGNLYAVNGQSRIYFALDDYTLGQSPLNNMSATNWGGAGEVLSFEFTVAISEWAGSGTTTLATRAVEEYLSTTSFSSLNVNRGPNGAALPTTTPAGTFESISFGPNPWNTTWLPTDIVSIEVDPFGNGKWTSIAGSIDVVSLTVQEGSLTYIGLGFYYDGTNWTLLRGKYRNPNTTNGVWSSMGAGARYRIKKVSSGAQVGYPVSARNIVGDTSGSVVPVGMLGETTTIATASGVNIGSGSNVFITGLTQTLSAGTWMLIADGTVSVTTPASGMTSGQTAAMDLRIQNTTDSTTAASITSVSFVQALSATTVCGGAGSFSLTAVLNLTSQKTFQVQGTYQSNITGGTTQIVRSGRFYAVRIA